MNKQIKNSATISKINYIKSMILSCNDSINRLIQRYKYYEDLNQTERTIKEILEHHIKWNRVYNDLKEITNYEFELVLQLKDLGCDFKIDYQLIGKIKGENEVIHNIYLIHLQ